MKFTRSWVNTTETYGWISISIHWLMALTILGMYPLGLYIVSLGYYDPGYRIYPNIHRSIGILVACLLIIRLIWSAMMPKPLIHSSSSLETIAAKAGHISLYLLLMIVVSSGYMISTADGRSIQVFDWFSVPALPFLATRQEDLAGDIHFYASTLMMILVGLHALAALKHHYISKDNTLSRMLGIKGDTQ
ncbi:cytochrome b [Nitrincola tibetensis]|uniref:Cytochrome b n=1 Tax=Nitrincola tibetensis TaxID=2219697 RepID=A0A364NM89_9GAMM|nr:cytochrome b [Nitrincola tibetensis]RAU18182.1 cytochrome b [Nitrincola tibetensis]